MAPNSLDGIFAPAAGDRRRLRFAQTDFAPLMRQARSKPRRTTPSRRLNLNSSSPLGLRRKLVIELQGNCG